MSKIYFATNREIKFETSKNANNFGDRFNAMGPQAFRLGHVTVTMQGTDPKVESNWTVGECRLYAENLNANAKGGVKLGTDDFFEDLRLALKSECHDLIIYIHGFANDFENTALRAAQLEAMYSTQDRPVRVVMFSWPSNGRVAPAYEYFSDRDDAEASGIAMARALDKLVTFLHSLMVQDHKTALEKELKGEAVAPDDFVQCGQNLHVLAHSMGNWALRHAVNKFMRDRHGVVPRIFEHAFLMAADADADALADRDKLGLLADMARYVHVYHARDDRALKISDRTKGNPDRLGSEGPADWSKISERVLALDCQDISETTFSDGRHQYYRLRDEIITDVIDTLTGKPQEGRARRETIRAGRHWRLKPAS